MHKNWTLTTTIALSTLLLPACGLTGNWPNLSDKTPDPASRTRVIERAVPAQPMEPSQSTHISSGNAENWLQTKIAAIEETRQTYEDARRSFEEQKQQRASDEAVLIHTWLEAQLALTRLSQLVSELDQLISSPALKGREIAARATQAKARLDAFTVKERQELEQIKPQNM